MPVVATTAYLCVTREVNTTGLLCALLAVIGVVLFHAAGNLLSDVGDFRSGADSREAHAVPNLVEHIFEPKEYLRLSAALFALGIAIGLVLTYMCGWLLLVIGGLGYLLTLLYTKSKNYWLSDVNIFIIFGILIVLGSSVAVVHTICFDTLVLSLPLGLITLSVLHANNTVDIKTDRAAGLHTLAMAMGEERAAKVYISYQIIPYIWVIISVLMGWLPWTALLCLVSFGIALGNIRQASTFKKQGRDAMVGLDLRSAKLQLIFSLTLAVGLLLALLFK